MTNSRKALHACLHRKGLSPLCTRTCTACLLRHVKVASATLRQDKHSGRWSCTASERSLSVLHASCCAHCAHQDRPNFSWLCIRVPLRPLPQKPPRGPRTPPAAPGSAPRALRGARARLRTRSHRTRSQHEAGPLAHARSRQDATAGARLSPGGRPTAAAAAAGQRHGRPPCAGLPLTRPSLILVKTLPPTRSVVRCRGGAGQSRSAWARGRGSRRWPGGPGRTRRSARRRGWRRAGSWGSQRSSYALAQPLWRCCCAQSGRA